MKKQIILPAALALALGASTALTIPGLAQAQAPATEQGQPPAAATPDSGTPPTAAPQQRSHRDFSSHIDGRIAYLKAELKITPAQQPQFDKVAQAMRQNAADRQKAFEDMRTSRSQPHSAVDMLNTRIKMSQDRARNDQRLLAAFKPLYDSLTPDQKQVADHMAAPHHFGHFGPGGPRRG